jgi:hypothetical protein
VASRCIVVSKAVGLARSIGGFNPKHTHTHIHLGRGLLGIGVLLILVDHLP